MGFGVSVYCVDNCCQQKVAFKIKKDKRKPMPGLQRNKRENAIRTLEAGMTQSFQCNEYYFQIRKPREAT